MASWASMSETGGSFSWPRLIGDDPNGVFRKWGYPNSWMVNYGKSYSNGMIWG